MGCVSSKKATFQSPVFDHASSSPLPPFEEEEKAPVEDRDSDKKSLDHSDNSREVKREASQKNAFFSIKRSTEADLVAAGWPSWLASVAGDAIQGSLPLKAEAYERLDKIGQGTYSNVYRARELKTGKMVAVKKVRFDNFQPESVRFMAREILILRKLDHPNVMKLEGIITSRIACTIYLVFEYMEHDLSGLLSCPEVKFTDSQIKCLMRQLLSGLQHCHSRGIMHRDIKCSNILVNNEGVLKIADFGLAYFTRPKNKQPLTSRVVTLWYRPPELLLGSTSYDETVDLWSVGCVFAELFIGRPILKGRNEVEQLHKIFKLCGSPSDEYWKSSKLPLATMFKPQQPYQSTIEERCREFPNGAVGLIETLLSVEPHKRGSAELALNCEYFNIKPYACDPSSMPKYPPNKEIDAKARDEARRKSALIQTATTSSRIPRRARKTLQESDFCKVVPTEEVGAKAQAARRNNGGGGSANRKQSLKQSYDTKSQVSQASQTTQESISSIRSLPVQLASSTSFGWVKRPKQPDVFTRLYNQATQKSHASDAPDSDGQENEDPSSRASGGEAAKLAMRRRQTTSFDSSEIYLSHDSSEKKGSELNSDASSVQSQETQNDQPRQVLRRSRFHKD